VVSDDEMLRLRKEPLRRSSASVAVDVLLCMVVVVYDGI
jgi:hypothetical protein